MQGRPEGQPGLHGTCVLLYALANRRPSAVVCGPVCVRSRLRAWPRRRCCPYAYCRRSSFAVLTVLFCALRHGFAAVMFLTLPTPHTCLLTRAAITTTPQPLVLAAEGGHVEAIKALLGGGANINLTNNAGEETACARACFACGIASLRRGVVLRRCVVLRRFASFCVVASLRRCVVASLRHCVRTVCRRMDCFFFLARA